MLYAMWDYIGPIVSHLLSRRWFRVLFWLGLLCLLGVWLRRVGVLN